MCAKRPEPPFSDAGLIVRERVPARARAKRSLYRGGRTQALAGPPTGTSSRGTFSDVQPSLFCADRHLHGRACRDGTPGLLRTDREGGRPHLRGHQDRRGMEEAADARAVLRVAPARHRARRDQSARQAVWPWHLRVCRLRAAAVRLHHQVQQRHRLAELLCAAGQRRGHHLRPQLVHGSHRGALPSLRRPPRPRVRRRTQADWLALLHERRGAEVRSGEEVVS